MQSDFSILRVLSLIKFELKTRGFAHKEPNQALNP